MGSKMSIKLSTCDVNKRLSLVGFKLLGEYRGKLTEADEVYCLECGDVSSKKLTNVMLGKTICWCCERKRLTEERLSRFTSCLKESKFSLVSEWDGEHRERRVVIRCDSCSMDKEVLASTVLNKKSDISCKYCGEGYKARDLYRYEEFCSKRGFSILSEKVEDPLKVCCRSCGSNQTLKLSSVIDGYTGKKGATCRKCRYNEWVVDKAIWLESFGYKLLDYEWRPRGSSAEYLMRCMRCSNEFIGNIDSYSKERPMSGQCPSCVEGVYGGFRKDLPGILYHLRVDTPNGPLYKIGITNRTVQERFCKEDLENITVLRELHFDSGRKAYELERYYLETFDSLKYQGNHVLKSGGNTELFTRDIFGLDRDASSD